MKFWIVRHHRKEDRWPVTAVFHGQDPKLVEVRAQNHAEIWAATIRLPRSS